MIKLSKTAKPNVLALNSVTWTDAIISKLSKGDKLTASEKTKYRHPEVKAALISETNGKCAYCESKIKHVHHGDVEHISPKSLQPEKMFEWENLTIACEICNQNKSDKDPFIEHIIDPYKVDPSLHLVFMGALIFPLGTVLGRNTEVILDLNRVSLCEMRKEKLAQVMGIFETILRQDIPMVVRKTIFCNLVANEGSSSAAYSAMVTSAIATMKSKLPDELCIGHTDNQISN